MRSSKTGRLILPLIAAAALFWGGCGGGAAGEPEHPIAVKLLNIVSNFSLNDTIIETPCPILLLEFEVRNETNHPIELVDSCFSIRLSCPDGKEVAVELTPTTSGNMQLDKFESAYVAFRAFYRCTMSEQLLCCNEKRMSGAWIEKLTRQITVVYGCGKDWVLECERLNFHFPEI